jgi:hypothetical protein
MPPKKASSDWLRKIDWVDLDIILPGRLVLRHNERLQYGYIPEPCETLRFALKRMQDYCKCHRDGNPKITGLVKIVEHTKIDNVPLRVKLDPMFRARK